jgi:type 1 glutamine amidotransferase
MASNFRSMNRSLLLALAALCSLAATLPAAEPKKLLVVSATVGARHTSIPNGEKMLRELAARSNGQFTVVMMSDTADYPFSRLPGGGRGAVAGFPGAITAANAAQQDALTLAARQAGDLAALNTAVTTARTELTTASLTAPGTIGAKADALATAELNLALARAGAIALVQASANRFSPELLQVLSGATPAGRGGAPDRGPAIARVFQDFLSPAALKNYDGIILLNATGALPFPDRDAWMNWIADGHAVVAIHAAMDTGYYTPDAYVELLSGGSRYATSIGGSTTPRKVYKVDATHPASKDWPDGLAVTDEFFQFTHANPADKTANLPGLDRSKVHSLLDVDLDGQRLPVAWTRLQGKGRVFYTSLGHRDDVLLPATPALDGNAKLNPDEVSAAYQAHLLNGIRWALGLADGNTAVGNAK